MFICTACAFHYIAHLPHYILWKHADIHYPMHTMSPWNINCQTWLTCSTTNSRCTFTHHKFCPLPIFFFVHLHLELFFFSKPCFHTFHFTLSLCNAQAAHIVQSAKRSGKCTALVLRVSWRWPPKLYKSGEHKAADSCQLAHKNGKTSSLVVPITLCEIMFTLQFSMSVKQTKV